MNDLPLLTILTFLPLVGAFFVATISGDGATARNNARHTALYSSVFTAALSLYMFTRFDASNPGFQFVETVEWFAPLGLQYKMGVDGISIFFILLSTLLTPLCIWSAFDVIQTRVKEYMVAFLVLETLMIGTFCALDLFLFYVFFEAVLIPMFLIIGVWGGPRRIYASYKFFLYTLLGSVLMLIAMLWIYLNAGSDIPTLISEQHIPVNVQMWLWLAFFASFAVKMPMWPVHTWLPDAHVEAPTAGSVILAGVLLKMGGYGFLRFSLPMFPEASSFFAPMVMVLSIIAIIYASLVALAQTDMKKMIAYSSVAHMGFVTLGLFTFTVQGIEGALFQMISHGIISAALFLCVGVVYDRLHTRDLGRYGGLVNNMPKYATLFMIFMLGSVALPGTSGFVGEFMVLLGTFEVSPTFAFLAATGMVLGAAYMLVLYRKVIFGPQEQKAASSLEDVNTREFYILLPLALATLAFGILPGQITKYTGPSVERLALQVQAGLAKDKVIPELVVLPESAPAPAMVEDNSENSADEAE